MPFISLTQNLGTTPETWVNAERITHLTAGASGGTVVFLVGGTTLYVKEAPSAVVALIQKPGIDIGNA